MNKILLGCVFSLLGVSLVKGIGNKDLKNFGRYENEEFYNNSFYRLAREYHLDDFNGIYPIDAHWLITCKRPESVGRIKLLDSSRWQKVVQCVEHPTLDLCLVQVAEAIDEQQLKKFRLLGEKESLPEDNLWVLSSGVTFNSGFDQGLFELRGSSDKMLAAFSQVAVCVDDEIFLTKGELKDFDNWFYPIWRKKEIVLYEGKIENSINEGSDKETFTETLVRESRWRKTNTQSELDPQSKILKQLNLLKDSQKNGSINNKEILEELKKISPYRDYKSIFEENPKSIDKEIKETEQKIQNLEIDIDKKKKLIDHDVDAIEEAWEENCSKMKEGEDYYRTELKSFSEKYPEGPNENTDISTIVEKIKTQEFSWVQDNSTGVPDKSDRGGGLFLVGKDKEDNDRLILVGLTSPILSEENFIEGVSSVAVNLTSDSVRNWIRQTLKNNDRDFKEDPFEEPRTNISTPVSYDAVVLNSLFILASTNFQVSKNGFVRIENKNYEVKGEVKVNESGVSLLKLTKPIEKSFSPISLNRDNESDFYHSSNRVSINRDSLGTFESKLGYSGYNCSLLQLIADRKDGTQEFSIVRVGGSNITPKVAAEIDYFVLSLALGKLEVDPIDEDRKTNKILYDDEDDDEDDDDELINGNGGDDDDDDDNNLIQNPIIFSSVENPAFGQIGSLVGPQMILGGKDLADMFKPSFKSSKQISIGKEKRKITKCLLIGMNLCLFILDEPVVEVTPTMVLPCDWKEGDLHYTLLDENGMKSKFKIILYEEDLKIALAHVNKEDSHKKGGGLMKFDPEVKNIVSLNGMVTMDPVDFDLNFDEFIKLPLHELILCKEEAHNDVKETLEKYKGSTVFIECLDKELAAKIHNINLNLALGSTIK